MTKWILVECFSGEPGAVIALGVTPKSFVPLTNILRNPLSLADAESALADACVGGSPVVRRSADHRRRVLAEPLLIEPGNVHAVRLWVGPLGEPVAPRDSVGAWYFNLTTNRSVRSDELLDMYGSVGQNREREQAIAGAFTRLITNRDESAALAKIVNSEPGAEHQAVWTLRRDDSELRAVHFACRVGAQRARSGAREILVRGVLQDIGAADAVSAAPPPMILEYRLLEAATAPGEFRAIINLRTLRLIRWIGPPMPDIAWEDRRGQPAPQLHPEDVPVAKAIAEELSRNRAEAVLRLRRIDGDWQSLRVRAALMALDQYTTAGLVTVTDAGADPALVVDW